MAEEIKETTTKPQREIKRRHYLVEKLKCRDMVDKMLAEGYSYKDIAYAVYDAGERISDASICRYHNSMSRVAEKVMQAREKVKVLVEAFKNRPGTELAEVAEQVMLQGLLQKVAEADEEDFETMSLEKAGRLISALSRSGVNREKFKLEYEKAIKAASERIKEELRQVLADQPDLLNRLMLQVETILNNVVE